MGGLAQMRALRRAARFLTTVAMLCALPLTGGVSVEDTTVSHTTVSLQAASTSNNGGCEDQPEYANVCAAKVHMCKDEKMGSVVRTQCAKTCGACDTEKANGVPKVSLDTAATLTRVPVPVPVPPANKAAQANSQNMVHGVSKAIKEEVSAGVLDIVKNVGAVIKQADDKEEKQEKEPELSVDAATRMLTQKP